MKLNKKHLPFYAAFVQTSQYALAGWLFFFERGPYWGIVGAVCVGLMGALVSFSVAYAASQYAEIAEKRKRSSVVAMALVLLFSPIVVGTATWLHLTNIPSDVWRIVVAAAWGILPDGSVALAGFIAGKGMIEQGDAPRKPASKNGTSKKVAGKKKGKTKQIARKPMTDEALYNFIADETAKHPEGKQPSQQRIADHFSVKRQAVGPRLAKLKARYEVKAQ